MSEQSQAPDTSAVLPALDADEAEVMALVTSAYRRIRGWGLRTNGGEIEQAIHVIQGFIIQHMLQRLTPISGVLGSTPRTSGRERT